MRTRHAIVVSAIDLYEAAWAASLPPGSSELCRTLRATIDLRARAVAVFDAHSCPEALTTNVQPLFRRPFGPGKHRWGLTAEAEAFLRAGAARRARLIGVVLDS